MSDEIDLTKLETGSKSETVPQLQLIITLPIRQVVIILVKYKDE